MSTNNTPSGDGWQPILSAPRDGTRIEVFSPNMGISLAWWLEGVGSWVEDIGAGYQMPHQDWTHWRRAQLTESAS